jgi:1-acyl-sn-glycerol-3-phosphate acyltransferase
MKHLFYLVRFLYTAWFYILAAIPLILFFPVLMISALFPGGFPIVYWFARSIWSPIILWGMGTPLKVNKETSLPKGTSYMICPNHQSMLDIMVVLRLSKNPVLFVGKKELKQIPLFGFIYKNVSVLVDRSLKESRAEVYNSIKSKLQHNYSICIFPEGLVPEIEILLADFKPGAFKMAIEHQLDIVPISIYNAKDRLPYNFNHGRPGPIDVQVHSVFSVKNLEYEQYKELQNKCRFYLEEDLKAYKGGIIKNLTEQIL